MVAAGVLLSVPLSLGLSAESALRSSIGVYLAEFEPLLADYAFIALALIRERRLGDQSEFAPWLNCCPSLLPAAGFADLPLLWSEKELTGWRARRPPVRPSASRTWRISSG